MAEGPVFGSTLHLCLYPCYFTKRKRTLINPDGVGWCDLYLVTAWAAVQVSGANAPLAHLHMLQQLHGLPEVRAFPHLLTAKYLCLSLALRHVYVTFGSPCHLRPDLDLRVTSLKPRSAGLNQVCTPQIHCPPRPRIPCHRFNLSFGAFSVQKHPISMQLELSPSVPGMAEREVTVGRLLAAAQAAAPAAAAGGDRSSAAAATAGLGLGAPQPTLGLGGPGGGSLGLPGPGAGLPGGEGQPGQSTALLQGLGEGVLSGGVVRAAHMHAAARQKQQQELYAQLQVQPSTHPEPHFVVGLQS